MSSLYVCYLIVRFKSRELKPEMMTFLGIIATVMATRLTVTSADVFTSSLKINKMITEEVKLLDTFRLFLDEQYKELEILEQFYNDRRQEMSTLQEISTTQNKTKELEHPNGAFKAIRDFYLMYSQNLKDYMGLFGEFIKRRIDIAENKRVYLTERADVTGAKLSLLRLQTYYNLETTDMVRGRYLGHEGPALDAEEVYAIAETAFEEGLFKQSLAWLNVCLEMCKGEEANLSCPELGDILGLSGRVSLASGKKSMAESFYMEGSKFESILGEMSLLNDELNEEVDNEEEHKEDVVVDNSHRLCRLHTKLYYIENPSSPQVFCRYRRALLPYYTFKEEILSVKPFVSVFFDVISDVEGEHIKDEAQAQLNRAQVMIDGVSESRTGEVSWVDDAQSPIVGNISLRISSLLGLDMKIREDHQNGANSAEQLQVVNYGLGGHYDVHFDYLGKHPDSVRRVASGNRIATFLIYLNEVTEGGSTIFAKVNISVSPVRNMALFWYNFNPDHEPDLATLHAGCPVLVGQKWIANKWIREYGNTFKRRCGLYPNATQTEIEPDMFSYYGVKP